MKKLKPQTRKKLKKYWKKLQELQGKFNLEIYELESKMQNEIGIDDLEFINVNGCCGIGNVSRTIKLIHSEELEE